MRRHNGFTLIEVMCAAVILALAVATITGIVKNAQLGEGHARRQAEASMLADRLLAELEETAAQGAALQPGTRDVSDGIFSAKIEVAAFDPTALEELGGDGGSTAKKDSGSQARQSDVAAAGGWLATPEAEANPPVYQVTLHVAWDEGASATQVTRTSFFLNPVALKALEAEDAAEEAPE